MDTRAFRAVATLGFIVLSGCLGAKDASGVPAPVALNSTDPKGGDSGSGTLPAPSPSPTQAAPPKRSFQIDALLFNGSGVWASEESSLRSILTSHNASFEEINSAELEAMSVDDLAKYGVLIFPGGSGGTESKSVSADAHARLRAAVQQKGVGYVGFCAGAFVAVAPAPAAGKDVSYGFGIVDGPELDYYYLENQNVDVSMTLWKMPDGSTMDVLWYGGPITPNVPNGVVARYPDGNPSVSELWSGNGFVVLSGGHPTATDAMLRSLGLSSSDGAHLEFAWKMINAAIHQEPLPAF